MGIARRIAGMAIASDAEYAQARMNGKRHRRSIGTCRICGKPVYGDESRRHDAYGTVHERCLYPDGRPVSPYGNVKGMF